jgi:hypothetical protein
MSINVTTYFQRNLLTFVEGMVESPHLAVRRSRFMKRLSLVMIALIALSAFLTACGGGGAASDPTNVVKEAMQAVADKKFDKLAELTCAAKRADIENIFNPAGALAGAGVDAQKVLDAMTISIQDAQYTMVSEQPTAVVQMKAKMNINRPREVQSGHDGLQSAGPGTSRRSDG